MVEHYLDTVGVDSSILSGPTKFAVMRPLPFARVVAFALVLAAGGCGKFDVATAPEVSGPAPALDGTWDFEMERGAMPPCAGTMIIDGAAGGGSFTSCGSQSGSVRGSVDADQGVVLLFSPAGLDQFWIRGKLYGPMDLSGHIYGPSWNGQQVFDAVRR